MSNADPVHNTYYRSGDSLRAKHRLAGDAFVRWVLALLRLPPQARAGRPLNRVGQVVETAVQQRGFKVLRELTGHGVGRTIHEPPSVRNYYERRERGLFSDGLVVALEPIIAIGTERVSEDADGWTIRTSDGSLAAHFEHTVVITNGKPLILTAA